MRKVKSFISKFLVVAMVAQLFGCGYIIHPERRGQKEGQIDWLVTGLDAIGLLFFILPGVVAFAVDITNGTIYLPHGSSEFSARDLSDAQKIKIDPKNINKKTIEAAIKENSGLAVDLNNPTLQIYRNGKLEKNSAQFNIASSDR